MAPSSPRTGKVQPSRSEIQEELHRIFASPGFAQAERMQRFLRFVVERSLDGEQDCLKESVIGVRVFDREIGYDPKTDSIVRVEARRLRNKLFEYQRETGAQDPFWIQLPKGGYIPEFVFREESPAAPSPAPPPVRKGLGRDWIAAVLLVTLVCAAGVWLILGRSAQPAGPLQGRPFTAWPGSEVTPSFSPDGQTIAFGAGAIYTQRIGADRAVRLTHSSASEIEPVWSPDGQRIAFLRQETGGLLGIYAVAADGSGERRLNSIRSGLATARMDWSRDGRYLAAADRSEESRARIALFSTATGEKQWLALSPARTSEACPRFSPDGSALAFVRGLRDSVEDVYVAPFQIDRWGVPSAGQARRITFDNRNIYGIAWTADGRSLLVASRRVGSLFQLWRVPASGGRPVALTASAEGDAIQPAVSSKGNRLAYVNRFTDMNIWRAAVDGRTAPQPLVASTRYDTDPQYSPDGKRIAFRSDRSGNSAIWVADAEGKGAFRVADFNGPTVGAPRWSPDGNWLAFDSRFAEDTVICVAPADGSAPPHRLPAAPGSNNLLPTWSHDGAYLYFGSRRTGRWEIWKQGLWSDRAEQVTKQGGFDAFASADGKSILYSKGPAISGIWRLPGEELVLDSRSAPLWGWVPGRAGIYYVEAAANEESPADLRYLDLSTRVSRVIGRTSAKPAAGGTSLSVSPDERWIVFAEVDRAGSDIILVDPFR